MRKWRDDAGLTQEQAADQAGVRQATWSDVERGKSTPHLAFAIALESLTQGAVRIEDFGFSGALVDHMSNAVRSRRRSRRAA